MSHVRVCLVDLTSSTPAPRQTTAPAAASCSRPRVVLKALETTTSRQSTTLVVSPSPLRQQHRRHEGLLRSLLDASSSGSHPSPQLPLAQLRRLPHPARPVTTTTTTTTTTVRHWGPATTDQVPASRCTKGTAKQGRRCLAPLCIPVLVLVLGLHQIRPYPAAATSHRPCIRTFGLPETCA
ncbi:hypothetical protein Micbo1qcDRAFT_2099 [Microdochium bolleyi]|uniref:Uncharacterized protein n=1 Tax=Microdochium bolleyi TaxID=196109 RepID=A0A136JHL9_9PEZI|nr:hypothetical protein Micbo1qcDRAFT_2099 [Microdochium bolleyi]